MKKQKLLGVLLFSGILLVTPLGGCSKSSDSSKEAIGTTNVSSTEKNTTEAIPTKEDSTNKNTNNGITSLEFVKLMGNGINLGNTMEAYGHQSLGTTAAVSAYETLWGQPETTSEMIDGMKAAGFDTLRIPVAWTNAMAFESGDYTIGKSYLDRVEEIVNYALDADMYVIVNDHWDGGWWGMFGSATEETRNAAMDLYISMWTQVGERFKDYSDKLILESANEELGNRLNDVTVALDSGTLDENECYVLNTKINQAFVDIIRSTGSNNGDRFLLVAGYNTDFTMTLDNRFVMPTDSAMDKLLLSVHYYTPWSYCGTDSVSRWGTERHYNEQNELLANMTKFTELGVGIVIGEYAVLLKTDGTIKENTIDFYNNFLDNCDLYNYCPVLWDTNNLYKKDQLKIIDADIEALFKNRNYESEVSLTDEKIKKNAQESMNLSLEKAILNNADIDKQTLNPDDSAVSWIMFNSSDYLVTYSVGDIYDTTLKTDGVVSTDVVITGPGTYTVSLDFTEVDAGYANSTAFCAVGISNGELFFPGYIMNITDVQVNGNSVHLMGIPYTTSDNARCTRVNLFNEWVNEIPDEARTSSGVTSNVSPIILRGLSEIQTISVTYEYGPKK